MSLLEILQLVGYSVGAALPLWMSVLLLRQRRGLERTDRVLVALALALGLWHASNLAVTLQQTLGLDPARWSALLRAADTVAVTSITFCYSFLLHVHLHLWANSRARPLKPSERARVYLSYVPTLFLAAALPPIWTGPYAPMFEKLSAFVVPFGLWATYVLGLCAGTDFLIARSSASVGERRLMRTLAASFVVIAALLLSAFALGLGRGTAAGQYLQTLGTLGSLLPTALIAYHIYRYRYLELVIRESLVVASFAAVVLVVYLFVIRSSVTWLTARFGLRPGAVEALLILAFALLAAPLRAWLEKRFHRLFAREATLYRDVLARIGAQAARSLRLADLLDFIAERTAHELKLRRVVFYVPQPNPPVSDNAVNGVARQGSDAADGLKSAVGGVGGLLALAAEGGGVLEGEARLRDLGFEVAFALGREERIVGLMLVDAAPEALTADARAVLEVLAGQVAIAIEDRRLIEENLELERKLAHGERLAALGRMAATVAHEVKNPLSAIKSIAQVMREDERLAAEYARDLDLIVGEADRLSLSVTQLLSFARQPPPADAPARADELARSAVELFNAEARGRGVRLQCHARARAPLGGPQVAAVRDAVSNLLLNALQATPAGGAVTVEVSESGRELVFAVTDGGAGVPADLRERIWEPFFTTKQRGTGLGLAIVRKRIEEAGGRALLAPHAGGAGARFELRLPLAGAHKEVAEESVLAS